MNRLSRAGAGSLMAGLAFLTSHPSIAAYQSEAELESNLAYDDRETPPSLTRMVPLSSSVPEFFAESKMAAEVSADMVVRFLTFGNETSRVVTIVYRPEKNELLIDRNRDHAFSDDEHVSSNRQFHWHTTIPAEFALGQDRWETVDLTVAFIWEPEKKELKLGTVGAMRGKTSVGGREVSVVRTDDNSNGRWFDTHDRLWLDFNDNGEFEPFKERFECQSFLLQGQKRYVVSADEQGVRFFISENVAMGRLAAKVAMDDEQAQIDEIQIWLVSREGIPVKITSLNTATEVPAADYRVTKFRIQLRSRSQAFSFHFDRDSSLPSEWIVVNPDQTAIFDPLGEIEIRAKQLIQRGKETVLTLLPTVTTTTGLYLTRSKVGTLEPAIYNQATASSFVNDELFDASSSGFS